MTESTHNAETREPFEATCDVCAGESGALIVHVEPGTEAYICQVCWDAEEAAIQAGADALIPELRAHGFFWSTAAPYLARTVIDAYNAHRHPLDSDGLSDGGGT